MSKEKKPLLGPDGEPLDLEKYRPKGEGVTVAWDHATGDSMTIYLKSGWFGSNILTGGLSPLGSAIDGVVATTKAGAGDKPKKATLRSAVERDLTALHETAPADWKGHTEVPPIPAEQTDTYAVAFGSARKNCEHPNSHSTLHARHERQCDDCGRYFTRGEWWER